MKWKLDLLFACSIANVIVGLIWLRQRWLAVRHHFVSPLK